MIPPFALCTGREARIETFRPERINCKRCIAKLATIPTDAAANRAWMQRHGVGR